MAVLICFERSYRHGEERFEIAQAAQVRANGWALPVLIQDLSMEGARLWMETPAQLAVGEPFELDIPSIGIIRSVVVRADCATQELGVRFSGLTGESRHRLIRAIFTSPAVQYQPDAFALSPILSSLLRRFLGM